jgi:hypothetical protein
MSLVPASAGVRFPKGRRWKKVRFPCGPDLSACLFHTPDELPEKATLRNLSGIGISFLLNHGLEPGMMVLVQLINSATAFGCQVPMRVVSSVAQPDDHFLVDGAFARELRNAEVQGLLPEAWPLTDK